MSGELKKITGWTEFDPTQPDGNFFPITLDASYSGKMITVKKDQNDPKSVVDRNWIIKIPSKETTVTFSVDETVIFVLDFAGATLDT